MKQLSSMEYGPVFVVLVGVFFGVFESTCVDSHETEQGEATDTNQNSANHNITQCCLSDVCRRAMFIILSKMDQNREPCDDFYQFACGGHYDSTLDSDYGNDPIELTFSDDGVKQRMIMHYETKNVRSKSRHFRLAKNLYNSCMNTARIEADGLAVLKNILKKLGGWPVLDPYEWERWKFDALKMHSKIVEVGYPGHTFIKAGVHMEPCYNSSRHTFYLIHPDSGLPSGISYENYLNISNYFEYMVDIAVYLGANKHWAETLLIKSAYFQVDLHHLVQQSKANRESEHSSMTLGRLILDYPTIAWKEYFASLLPSNTSITDDDVVDVHKDCDLDGLYRLTQRYSNLTLLTYMLWRVVDHSILYLNEQVRNQYYAIRKHPYELEPRWKICVSEVIQSLPMSARALTAKNFFHFPQKYAAAHITSSIKTTFKDNIEKVDWLDSSTKRSILEKIDSLLLLTAYPDELRNDTEIDLYYQDLELTRGNYLESSLNVSLFKMRNSQVGFCSDKDKWKIIGIAVDITDWELFGMNAMFLSADELQGIYLSIQRPNYMNYGGIGTVIGRKIIQGVQYWKTFESSSNLNPQCIIKHYNTYSLKHFGHKTGGKLKMEANIADSVGYQQAYHAYIAWAAANKAEAEMPGLSYTPRQMFWIALANTFCSKLSSAEENNNLLFDRHSESDFRVNEPLSNSVEFSKDFNCPVGSRMNPVKKCRFM